MTWVGEKGNQGSDSAWETRPSGNPLSHTQRGGSCRIAPMHERRIEMAIQENIKLDEENLAAWNAHSPERELALLADNIVWYDVGTPEPMRNKEAIRQYLQ